MIYMKSYLWAFGLSATLLASATAADSAVGLWKTEPDRKNLVSLIEVTACGAALCGQVMKAYDASGEEVKTANVGKRLFWELKPEGEGRYSGGTVYVPLLDVTARASATLKGQTLKVTGCKGPVCDGQVWTRVR
jgi:uncharacterized protein (DUF2147 family)